MKMKKNALFHNIKESEKNKFCICPFNQDQYEKLMSSVLAQVPSSVQVVV